MEPADQAAELEALAMLRLLRERLDVSGLSAEDRQTVATWWSEAGEPKRTEFSIGTVSGVAMLTVPPDDLDPRVAVCAMAVRTFASAIESGVPGAELETDELLRACGFDDDDVEQILGEMVARAPLPAPETLN